MRALAVGGPPRAWPVILSFCHPVIARLDLEFAFIFIVFLARRIHDSMTAFRHAPFGAKLVATS